MLLREIFEITNERQVWARNGKAVVRKYRCSGGRRDGRVVAKMSQCFAAPDIKKSLKLKQTKKKVGSKMLRKANRTKRTNPASKRLKYLNR